MQDPPRENISGEKWDGISHTFNWGQITQGAAVIVVALLIWWFLWTRRQDKSDENDTKNENTNAAIASGEQSIPVQ